jgi:hypothetical protein
MRDRGDVVRRLLLIAGIIEVVAGLAHFAIPSFAYQARGLALLTPDESGLVSAAILSVGILLIAFGALTIRLASKSSPAEILMFYATLNSILWVARVVVELIYPVRISLFLVARPTVLLLPAFVLESALFLAAAVLLRAERRSPLPVGGSAAETE